jgi:hypothetical protein
LVCVTYKNYRSTNATNEEDEREDLDINSHCETVYSR